MHNGEGSFQYFYEDIAGCGPCMVQALDGDKFQFFFFFFRILTLSDKDTEVCVREQEVKKS